MTDADTIVGNDTTTFVVEEIEPIMKCIPFAIQLPSGILFNEINSINNDNNDDNNNNDPNMDIKTSNVTTATRTTKQKQQNILWDQYNSYGIVGTITYIGPQSVLIWFGWGEINSNSSNT